MQHVPTPIRGRPRPQTIIKEGQRIDKLYVIKSGEVSLLKNGAPCAMDPAFVKEVGGFSYFGDGCLPGAAGPDVSPYTVVAASQGLQLLCLTFKCVANRG